MYENVKNYVQKRTKILFFLTHKKNFVHTDKVFFLKILKEN